MLFTRMRFWSYIRRPPLPPPPPFFPRVINAPGGHREAGPSRLQSNRHCLRAAISLHAYPRGNRRPSIPSAYPATCDIAQTDAGPRLSSLFIFNPLRDSVHVLESTAVLVAAYLREEGRLLSQANKDRYHINRKEELKVIA